MVTKAHIAGSGSRQAPFQILPGARMPLKRTPRYFFSPQAAQPLHLLSAAALAATAPRLAAPRPSSPGEMALGGTVLGTRCCGTWCWGARHAVGTTRALPAAPGLCPSLGAVVTGRLLAPGARRGPSPSNRSSRRSTPGTDPGFGVCSFSV